MAENGDAETGNDPVNGNGESQKLVDAESLYRRAPKGCIVDTNDGERISSTAFNDRGNKPSVDRAVLRNSPEETKEEPTDGIIEMTVADVRGIRDIRVTTPSTEPPTYYAVDVLHRPIAEDAANGVVANPAHSQIEASPHPHADSRFKKIKEALALIATKRGWLIRPQ